MKLKNHEKCDILKIVLITQQPKIQFNNFSVSGGGGGWGAYHVVMESRS